MALGWVSCMRRSDCTYHWGPGGLPIIDADSGIMVPRCRQDKLIQSVDRWASPLEAATQRCTGQDAQRIRDRPGGCSMERVMDTCGICNEKCTIINTCNRQAVIFKPTCYLLIDIHR